MALAVAFGALLPFFATYSEKVAPSALSSVFGEKILICTGEGFQWVKWEDLQSGKSPIQHHKAYSCPLCYVAHNVMGKLLLAAAFTLLLMAHARERALFTLRVANAYARPHNALYPRAPPISFIY